MEPPPKRQRRHDHDNNETSRRDEPGQTPFGGHHANAFNGTGIQSSGNFTVTGDLHMYMDSLMKEKADEIKKQKEEIFKEEQRKAREQAKKKLLDSLEFPQMHAREFDIKKAHASTCKWILTDHQYERWAQSRHNIGSDRFIWLKGKPGTGKSTIMKFLLEHIRRQSALTGRKEVFISFFFNARGNPLERSVVGLYRSLLLQLFQQLPETQDLRDFVPPTDEWTVNSLEAVFERAASYLEEVSLTCLIDALDECGSSQIRSMVGFFDRITQTHQRLHVCFASRHYPHVGITSSLEIILERQDEHQKDISRYLTSKLQIGYDSLADQICSDILAKASGVFMWVVLVVDILNREFDAGRKHTLQRRLHELPKDLHTLFRDILTRDTENKQGLLLCIQWIAFARRPLTPEELYFAIISGTEPENLEVCHHADISAEDIRKYILDNSKGLAEPFGDRDVRVQFIHESVVDYLVKDNGLAAVFTDLGTKLLGNSHNSLKLCCLRYIEFVELYESQYEQDEGTIQDFSFEMYAQNQFIFHADEAELGGIDQKDFVVDLSLGKWITASQDSYSPSALYLLVRRSAKSLIRAHPTDRSCFAMERGDMPIIMAAALGRAEITSVLLELEVHRVPALSFQDLCRHVPLLDDSMTSVAQKGIGSFRDDVDIFVQVTRFAPELASIICLRTMGANVNVSDRDGKTPLFHAIHRQHNNLLNHLISTGANLSQCDGTGAMAGHWAARFGNIEAFTILEKNMCKFVTSDAEGRTPLHLAVERDDATINFLVRHGVDIVAKDKEGRTPLHYAMISGHLTNAECLLLNKADFNATDDQGLTPLRRALLSHSYKPWSIKKAIGMLQKYGADVSAIDHDGKTALHWSIELGLHHCVVELVRSGADISKPDSNQHSPIWRAIYASPPDIRIIQFLIHHGADIYDFDKDGYTLLHRAIQQCELKVVEVLVTNGASTKARNKNGLTPLDFAMLFEPTGRMVQIRQFLFQFI